LGLISACLIKVLTVPLGRRHPGQDGLRRDPTRRRMIPGTRPRAETAMTANAGSTLLQREESRSLDAPSQEIPMPSAPLEEKRSFGARWPTGRALSRASWLYSGIPAQLDTIEDHDVHARRLPHDEPLVVRKRVQSHPHRNALVCPIAEVPPANRVLRDRKLLESRPSPT